VFEPVKRFIAGWRVDSPNNVTRNVESVHEALCARNFPKTDLNGHNIEV